MTSIRTGSNLVHVKYGNLSVVLEAIHRLGLVSRTELTASTLLTPSTITNLVNELLQQNLLYEAGSTASQGGRKRTLLSLNHTARWAIALTVTPKQIEGALVDLRGHIGWRCIECTEESRSGHTAVCDVVCSQLARTAHDKGWPVLGIGIAGDLTASDEEPEPWWQTWVPGGFPAHAVRAEHMTRAAALAELWFGAGSDVESLVYVNCDAPVSIGVVMQRRLFNGAHGQVAVNCADILTGTGSVVDGDQLAALSSAVQFAIRTYDPELIVLGGKRSCQIGTDQSTLINRIATSHSPGSVITPTIKFAQTGNDAALIGAACLVLDGFFADPLGAVYEVGCSSGSDVGKGSVALGVTAGG